MKWAAAILLTLLAWGQAIAAGPVSMQRVLAIDVSGSVSQTRFELQPHGYAKAFRSPATGSIAVTMVQWTGPALHVVTVDWIWLVEGRPGALPLGTPGDLLC